VIDGSWFRRRRTRLGPLALVLALVPSCERGTVEAKLEAEPVEPAAPQPELPAAELVLERAVQAMGGKQALARIHSFYYRGTMEMPGQNVHGSLEIWWKGGDFYMEQHVPGHGQVRAGKQGDEIWTQDPIHRLRKLSGAEAEQLAWASSLLLPAEWRRYFQSAQTVAARSVDGRTLYDVELAAPSGLRVVMSFDAESGLQVGQSFDQLSPMGKQPVTVRFEDFREVDGIKLSYRHVIDVKIQHVVEEITEIRLNAAVDETRFAYPRAGADLVRQAPSAPTESPPPAPPVPPAAG
jgi:hypothetical protein